ncbi:uncharacterized protein LOC113174095 [Anabas testudineus]|uniref:uncharacterized protein LOC113174095 n=1 Tax=Anabas testudineus TaxID=64144 RepID=UPI000E459A6B|nr:uncharacterized protein LOC113174095 [Anabas testudineus]
MSVQLYSASGSGGNEASIQGTTVGGSKPLHRFIRGQPKIVGIIALILGASSFIVSMTIYSSLPIHYIWTAIPPGFIVGSLFIISGILFILTEHNPTKKTVTLSLAFSIVAILGAVWSVWHMIPDLVHGFHYRNHQYIDEHSSEADNRWLSNSMAMGLSLEIIFTFYNLVGIIIFIVMSCFAGAALRSTKSQAVVVMTTAPPETPAE